MYERNNIMSYFSGSITLTTNIIQGDRNHFKQHKKKEDFVSDNPKFTIILYRKQMFGYYKILRMEDKSHTPY